MFCYQCQEAARNQGCTVKGVCGKTDDVAKLQDLLVYVTKGVAIWSLKAREYNIHHKKTDAFILEALFTTVTNVNFDPARIYQLTEKGLELRQSLKAEFESAYQRKNGTSYHETVPEPGFLEVHGNINDFIARGSEVGVLSRTNEDIRSLQEILLYGVKGMAAYAQHAALLGYEHADIVPFIEKALVATTKPSVTQEELFDLIIEAGKVSVTTLALLDKANTESYGIPEITEVYTGTETGPGILVSGHDLKDFEELLKQTEHTGVNVYTHGEMLPAHAYPAFKKYKHLIGNYGTSWYNQQQELADFNGPVIFTTNCIQEPKAEYKDRVFTTGLTGWQGVKHIADREHGQPKDFSAVIQRAKASGSIKKMPGKKIPIGFNHHTILSLADKIVESIKSGTIKRFVVMAGCDGRHKERAYFSEVARSLPAEAVILTAGCAKYRYNLLDLGTIAGIPRVIDAGQCNDSYSLAVVALKLAEVFKLNDINNLPISFDIAWYEQKAVCVLLALLYLGVKGIRLGPTLPAFISPNVANVLADKFNLKQTATAEQDVQQMMAGA
jgi:hydroxylamine reductase